MVPIVEVYMYMMIVINAYKFKVNTPLEKELKSYQIKLYNLIIEYKILLYCKI